MKFLVYIVCAYLIVLTALPSVRSVKLHHIGSKALSCEKKSSSSSFPEGCEKSKFITSLNFSPLQFVSELRLTPDPFILEAAIGKNQSHYEKIFIPKYQNTIWHPPKTSSLL
ncbi:hypothetical protein [Flavobacterium saliperosum]|uniref:hypothetical protein n=1 Tax=Flavobacterium saliperosum TaxID=329186 RepID=UPI00115FECF1|nr:hypothetical protein [Flavobacterium saliperosum]